jgi:imidazolonepropionase-like amidohydrolase
MNMLKPSTWATGLLTLLLALVPSGAAGQTERLDGQRDPQPARATLAIVGGLLIDGHEGPPRPHSIVLIDGNKIVAVGTRDTLTVPAGARVIDAGGMTVMPGLIDAHVHMDIIGHTNYAYWHKTYASRYEEIIAVSARQLLMNGVTTVVDLSGQPEALIAVRKKVDSGQLPGPRMKVSMGWISNWPDAQWERHHRKTFTWNAHTAEEARAAAQKVIEYGADLIKVHGGLTRDQIAAIAEEARKKNLRITGHVGNRADLLMRISNGQDAIEHLGLASGSSSIHPEVLAALQERRTYVIPTLIQSMIQINALEWPDWTDNQRARSTTPPDLWADISRSLAHPERLNYFGGAARARGMREQGEKFKQLWGSGVRVLVGTDGGTPLNFQTDATWQEMDLMVRYGVPPMDVIAAATRHNAEYIRMGSQIGTITPGKLADLIVVDGNPLISMRDLRNVVAVVKDGKVYKGGTSEPRATPTASRSQR